MIITKHINRNVCSLTAQTLLHGVVALRYNKVPQLHATQSEPFTRIHVNPVQATALNRVR